MFAATVKRFVKPSCLTNVHDVDGIWKASIIATDYLVSNAIRWIRARLSKPILRWHGNDTTPLNTKELINISAGTLSVERRGRQAHDFLAERLFLRDIDGGTVVVFSDYPELQNKSAWASFVAGRQLMGLPLEHGHASITLNYHCYDGAVFSAIFRHNRQLARALCDQISARDGDKAGLIAWVRQWTIGNVCTMHIAQGSCKNSVLDFSRDPDALRSMWIVTESLRNSYMQLFKCLGAWMDTVLTFADWDVTFSGELWHVLGIEPKYADALCDMQVRFLDGRLLVAKAYEN
jgi:hypothetical protein